MVDLRRLRALRAVADHGTLAAAADALHLTPSAVSQQLSALERELGHGLLEPAGRSVRLTPAAHVLLRHADALFAQLEKLEGDLAAQDSAPRGEVRIGGFPTALAGLLAPAARPLRAAAPAHRVTRGRLAGYGVEIGREVAANDREHGEAAAGALLDGPEPPTGLLCMSDELAIGALAAAARRGISVPQELSVVGWDDTPEALRADPPLTTIRQSLRDQGRRCAELAAAGATDPVEPQPWELIIRGTTEGFRPLVR